MEAETGAVSYHELLYALCWRKCGVEVPCKPRSKEVQRKLRTRLYSIESARMGDLLEMNNAEAFDSHHHVSKKALDNIVHSHSFHVHQGSYSRNEVKAMLRRSRSKRTEGLLHSGAHDEQGLNRARSFYDGAFVISTAVERYACNIIAYYMQNKGALKKVLVSEHQKDQVRPQGEAGFLFLKHCDRL